MKNPRGKLFGFSAGMKSKPLVLVRDPLANSNYAEKLLTTIENPEKPGELIWVEYTGEVSEEDRIRKLESARKSATEEELKELDAREALHRKRSTRGTKSDKWICAICGQEDDHWPPKCPNPDDSRVAKRHLAEFEAQGRPEPVDCGVTDMDALSQASKGSGGQIYTHWQCRICGEIDDHWPRMCPFRYLNPTFVITSRDRSSATEISVDDRGEPLFCGICGGRTHVPEYCRYGNLVKLFTGTPPPVKTIIPPKRRISWSTDFLVLPEPLDIPEYQPEMMPRREEDDFFASPEEMIDYIKEINNKSSSKASGSSSSMAKKPLVVGGAWTPPPRPLEVCRVCCKRVKHSYLRCPYLLSVPPGASVGPGYEIDCYQCSRENCYKHPKSHFARRISSLRGSNGPFKTSEDAPNSGGKGRIYNKRKRCYQEIEGEVSFRKRLQKPSFDRIEARQQGNAFSLHHFI